MRLLVLTGALSLLAMVSRPVSAQMVSNPASEQTTSNPAATQKADLARVQRATLRGLERPEVQAAFEKALKDKKPDEARAVAQQLATHGVQRLSTGDLRRRAELLLEFTGRANTTACGQWARGQAGRDDMVAMIAQLDSVALDTWVDLGMRATVAEVRQKPTAFPGTEADVSRVFERLPTAMTKAEVDRFHAVAATFERASPEDACWFGRQLYVAALALKPNDRDHALRTLAWMETLPN
jgi:hypothetical protein